MFYIDYYLLFCVVLRNIFILNLIGDVIVTFLSSHVIDRGFEPRLG